MDGFCIHLPTRMRGPRSLRQEPGDRQRRNESEQAIGVRGIAWVLEQHGLCATCNCYGCATAKTGMQRAGGSEQEPADRGAEATCAASHRVVCDVRSEVPHQGGQRPIGYIATTNCTLVCKDLGFRGVVPANTTSHHHLQKRKGQNIATDRESKLLPGRGALPGAVHKRGSAAKGRKRSGRKLAARSVAPGTRSWGARAY